MRARLAAVVGGALIAAVVVACGAAAASVNSTKLEIGMRGNSYSPRRAEITLGDTIVWVNKDIVRHDATKSGVFDSGELQGGERYEWVPADTGLVEYRCTIHQRMRGQIRVAPKQ